MAKAHFTDDEALTMREAAAALNVTEVTARSWAHRGFLDCVLVKGRLLTSTESVARLRSERPDLFVRVARLAAGRARSLESVR